MTRKLNEALTFFLSSRQRVTSSCLLPPSLLSQCAFVMNSSRHFVSAPLQVLDDGIFAFFAVEMIIKMVALGIFGSNCYLGDRWNQLDFVIVMAG